MSDFTPLTASHSSRGRDPYTAPQRRAALRDQSLPFVGDKPRRAPRWLLWVMGAK